MTKTEFIKEIAKYVKKYAPKYNIKCYSAVIAQAALESNWGKSKLSSEYHNYFGMKCGSKWTGKSVNMKTQEEYKAGTKTTIRDNFRVYASMEEGVKGYFEFIQLARYAGLKGITEPKKYLETIKAAGYATSSAYVKECMSIVNQYKLTQYDPKTAATKKAETTVDVETKKRNEVVQYLKDRLGIKEGSTEHKAIIKLFNDSGLCTRYKMTTKDSWCATAASAAYIAAGLGKIFSVECSCGKMIEKAKSMGIWEEKDSYVPKTAEAVLYDWQDSGKGDNTGWPDHIGLVVSVSGNIIKVIEGNYKDTVKYREIEVNGRYIRGFIKPKFPTK